MGYWLQGIQLSTGPAMSKLSQDTSVNVAEFPIYGSDTVEIQIVSIANRNMQISIPIRKDDTTSTEQVEYVVDNLNGLLSRLSPLHVRSDEVPIYGSSKDVFVVLTGMKVDWQAGTQADSLIAIVNLDCMVVGTPDSCFGIFAVKSQMRAGDYVGVIAGRSTIGLPTSSLGFVPNANQQVLESRNGTTMLDLGHTTYGFCDDTTAQEAEDVDVGEVRFNIDTTNMAFLNNGVKIYDEGFSPRKRVLSRYHDFTGNLAIESELYRIVMNAAAGTVAMYNFTGTGTYAGSPFETFRFFGMTGFNVVINKDEMVRVHGNNGDYLEIERGKDPVIKVNELGANVGFGYTQQAGTALATTGSVNYVQLSANCWIASNYQFDTTVGQTIVTRYTSDPPVDQVFSIIYWGSGMPSSGRHREVLKEIS